MTVMEGVRDRMIRSHMGTSLVVQWLRLCTSNEGGRVPSLIWELDAATKSSHAATKNNPACHNEDGRSHVQPNKKIKRRGQGYGPTFLAL